MTNLSSGLKSVTLAALLPSSWSRHRTACDYVVGRTRYVSRFRNFLTPPIPSTTIYGTITDYYFFFLTFINIFLQYNCFRRLAFSVPIFHGPFIVQRRTTDKEIITPPPHYLAISCWASEQRDPFRAHCGSVASRNSPPTLHKYTRHEVTATRPLSALVPSVPVWLLCARAPDDSRIDQTVSSSAVAFSFGIPSPTGSNIATLRRPV